MADPMTMGALAGAVLGTGKYFLVDKPKERRQRRLAAATIRYSPWTGMKPQDVQEADLFGNLLQSGVAGAQFGQNISDYGVNQELSGERLRNLRLRNDQLEYGAPVGYWDGMDPRFLA